MSDKADFRSNDKQKVSNDEEMVQPGRAPARETKDQHNKSIALYTTLGIKHVLRRQPLLQILQWFKHSVSCWVRIRDDPLTININNTTKQRGGHISMGQRLWLCALKIESLDL